MAGMTDAAVRSATALARADATAAAAAVLDQVDRVMVGKRDQLTLVLAAILAGGHVLIEDLPGLGKTMAARALAEALGLDFRRAQFTPDLLPADLTGSYVYRQSAGEFEFRPGPIFAGLLLADEINRTPPKTQAALLEAMQERQVTVEGQTFPLRPPFHVVATANPIEHEGTYPLPEAQLDRFLLRVSFGYPSADQEWEVLARRIARQQEVQHVDEVLTRATLLALQAAIESIHVAEPVGRYAVALVGGTRTHPDALVGASPRGSLALMTCSRALALIRGRDFVAPEDVQDLAPAALTHRVSVRPELWLSDVTSATIVDDVVRATTVPDAPGA